MLLAFLICPPPDFYPRSPCGERRYVRSDRANFTRISIHALLAESDRQMPLIKFFPGTFLSTLSLRRATHYDNYNLHCTEISIHALLAESDVVRAVKLSTPMLFLSTLSLRRATLNRSAPLTSRTISIHALLAESDRAKSGQRHSPCNFYPRSPCGERLFGIVRHT